MLIDTVHVVVDSFVNDTIVQVNSVAECPDCVLNSKSGGTGDGDFYSFLKTIGIALLAGLVALYQVKSNVISSARIKWMEELRTSLSSFYTNTVDSKAYDENYKGNLDNLDFHKRYSECMTEVNKLGNKIKLLLYSGENDYPKLEELIDKIDEMIGFQTIDNFSQDDFEIELKKMMTECKSIFREEWRRSKSLFGIKIGRFYI